MSASIRIAALGIIALGACGAGLWVWLEAPAEEKGDAQGDPGPASLHAVHHDETSAGGSGLDQVPAVDGLPVVEDANAQPLRSNVEPTTELDRLKDQLLFGATAQERMDAAEALEGWVPGEGEQALAAASRLDAEASVRETALEVLFEAGSLVSLQAFSDAFSDGDEWVRLAAENGLYDHTNSAASTGVLASFCASDDRDLRIRAAELLDEMSSEEIPWDDVSLGPTTFHWAPESPLDGAK